MGILDTLEEFAFGTKHKQSSHKIYPQELESLIDIAIEDGNITGKERLVLYKKAEKYGIDPDELDMVLESRLSKNRTTASTIKSDTIKTDKKRRKCPMCGALLTDQNMVRCPYCGVKVINVIHDLLEELDSVAPPKRAQQNTGFFGKIADFIEAADLNGELCQRKENIILGYNVPIEKEAILEFLAFSVLKGHKDPEIGYWTEELGEAWYKKSELVITEARKVFSQDAELMTTLKNYAIKLGMEKKGLFRR